MADDPLDRLLAFKCEMSFTMFDITALTGHVLRIERT